MELQEFAVCLVGRLASADFELDSSRQVENNGYSKVLQSGYLQSGYSRAKVRSETPALSPDLVNLALEESVKQIIP